MELLLSVQRIGGVDPTARVLACDGKVEGRTFRRGAVWHTFSAEHRTMTGHYSLKGWENVKVSLKAKGRRLGFQPWIEGALEQVVLPVASDIADVTVRNRLTGKVESRIIAAATRPPEYCYEIWRDIGDSCRLQVHVSAQFEDRAGALEDCEAALARYPAH
jgi:hypothetical protein